MKKAELEAIFQQDGEAPDLGPIEVYLHALATEPTLPAFAVGMCTARIEESAPVLCALLARAADGEALSEDEATLAFRGLHILGGARAHQVWPVLLRLLRRPEGELDALIGDGITETLGRIVTGVFDGDVEGLFDLIADRGVDEFVREAVWDAATFLAWDGRIERDRMRRFLAWFYEDRRAGDGDQSWIGWLEAIAHLGLRDLAPLVERAWSDGLVPIEVMEPHHFEQDLADAERAPDDIERLKRHRLGYIDDVLEALEWNDYEKHAEGLGGDDWASNARAAAPIEPVTNPMRHVGRNDPCPCGSGKKAKKCCLGG
jgi:hypothetical protein